MLRIYLRGQRACSGGHKLTELIGQNVGTMPLLSYVLGTCLLLLLHGFVAKQVGLILLLSKPI